MTVKIRALEKEADTLDLVRRLEGAGAQMFTGKVLVFRYSNSLHCHC